MPPFLGFNIQGCYAEMLKNYYWQMGWSESGVPLPETLKGLGLDGLVKDLLLRKRKSFAG